MIATDLLDMYPSLTNDDIRSTSMGANGEDVQLSSAARKLIPFSFEAKNQEKLNIWSAIGQARANCPVQSPPLVPIVVFKKNNEKPHVVISWEHFKDILCKKACIPDGTCREEALELLERLQTVLNGPK